MEHQHRFGSLAIIALLVGVSAVIGGIGFLIMNRETRASSASTDSKKTNQNQLQTTQDDRSRPAALRVKEWGITIPLPDASKDAYYVTSTSSQGTDGKPNTIFIGTQTLDALGCKASDANTGKSPLASIIRVETTDTDPVSGKPYNDMYPDGVAIGNYYYAYISWPESNENNCLSQPSLLKLDSALKSSIKLATSNK